jgi:hypothetical protein
MEVKKPIFIVGIGRSGTTIIHSMLSEHPNVAWLSGICRRNPEKRLRNRWLMQAIDYPFVGKYLKRRFKQQENYEFWEYYCKGFSVPCRDLVAEDVTEKTKQTLRRVFGDMLTAKRLRLLIKITGWPRVGFLHEIFEDSKFIHIVRDGRAVANSRIDLPWWDGWQGPWNWKRGPLCSTYMQEWERYNRSFVALAGIEWKMCLDAMEAARQCLSKDNFLEIQYEDFCDGPLRVMKEITDFCELAWTSEFEARLQTYTVKSANNKWSEGLTEGQKRVLHDVTRPYLEKYGYISQERRLFDTVDKTAKVVNS